MKTQFVSTVALTLAAAAGLYAQNSTPVSATVPFDFIVGKYLLPAGDYSVQQASAGMTVIRSADRKTNLTIMTHTARSVIRQEQTRLVFNRYGNEYFLSKVWIEGSEAGTEARPNKRENELRAGRAVATPAVVLASR